VTHDNAKWLRFNPKNDPQIISPFLSNVLDASQFNVIEIRMIAFGGGIDEGRVYFTTPDSPQFSQDKSRRFFEDVIKDGAPHVYSDTMKKVPGNLWNGEVTGLRIDPIVDGDPLSGDDLIEIDYIRLLSCYDEWTFTAGPNGWTPRRARSLGTDQEGRWVIDPYTDPGIISPYLENIVVNEFQEIQIEFSADGEGQPTTGTVYFETRNADGSVDSSFGENPTADFNVTRDGVQRSYTISIPPLTLEKISRIRIDPIVDGDPSSHTDSIHINLVRFGERVDEEEFVRGDFDGDYYGTADGVRNFHWQFLNGPPPDSFVYDCWDVADINDDGMIDVSDPAYFFNWYFGCGGTPPPPPYPNLGPDPTPDNLNCGPPVPINTNPNSTVDSLILHPCQIISLCRGCTHTIKVYASHTDSMEGFSISCDFDETVLEVVDVDSTGTILEQLNPLLYSATWNNDEGWVTVGFLGIYGTTPSGVIPPGIRQHLLNITVREKQCLNLPVETTLALVNGLGNFPVHNCFAVDGQSIYPVTSCLDAGIIAGTVRDSYTQDPIEGVMVFASGSYDFTEINGEYSVKNVLQGIHEVNFSHPDFRDTTVIGIEVTAGDTSYLSIMMEGMGDIVGTVVSAATGNSLQGALVEVLQNDQVVGNDHTAIDGSYNISDLPVGICNVRCSKHLCDTSTTRVEVYAGQAEQVDFQLNETIGIDLGVDLSSIGLARWGFNHTYLAQYRNWGSQVVQGVTAQMWLDSLVSYISSSPPGSFDANLLTWQFDSLVPGEEIDVSVTVSIDTAVVPVGALLTTSSNISFAGEDIYSPNDSATVCETVVNSWDPNDKLVYPRGIGQKGYIRGEQRINYTIFFENVDSATAEAVNITIVDILDPDLDWTTLSIGAMSHPDKCTVSFDSIYGHLTWHCDSIMLPPNVNPPEGEGYVTFSISPYYLPHGAEVSNSAEIKFDYNPWMVTPEEGPVVNTIDEFPPSSAVVGFGEPLSTKQDSSGFIVLWEGTDDSLGYGSGIKDYTIYVSDNGGSYEVWIENTSDTVGLYTGQIGHEYCFYSIATDNVGNVERVPYTPDACYTVVGMEEGGIETLLPKTFSLFQNYPNPFNPITEIKYALPKDCYVRLEIYNILGQKVVSLVDGEQKAGYKMARWDASSFSSGIYFYRLQAGDFVKTRKMVLLG